MNKTKEKKMIKKILTFCLIGLISLLTACSGPEEITITIEPDGNNMAFKTKEFNVSAGQPVKLIMKNTATMEAMKHNIVILNDESKVQEVGMAAISAPNYLPQHTAIIAATDIADVGQSTEITFNAPKKPGKYIYICTFPGHYMGMQGYMVVK